MDFHSIWFPFNFFRNFVFKILFFRTSVTCACVNGVCVDSNICDCSGTGYEGTTCSQDINECEINNGGKEFLPLASI